MREAEEAAGKDHTGRVEQARWVTSDPDRPDGIPVAALGPASDDALAPYGTSAATARATGPRSSTVRRSRSSRPRATPCATGWLRVRPSSVSC
ncbi:hypothetical protein NKG05_03290 [Oerskovia sp. M15]